MKSFKLFLCGWSLMSLAVLTACNEDDGNGGGGNGGGNGGGVSAPTNLAGRTMTVTVDTPPENAGSYSVTFNNETTFTSNAYGDGTYTYDPSGNSGLVTLATGSGTTVASQLTFNSTTSGTIVTEITPSGGSPTTESGTFILTAATP